MAFALLVAVSGCAPYYTIFGKKSDFFTEREEQILNKSVKALELGRGYDPRVDIDYIYTYSFTPGNKNELSSRLSESLKDIPSEEFISFYEKIFRLKALTGVRKKQFEQRVDMINYTYVKNYLLPGILLYASLLEEEAVRRDGSYIKHIDTRKSEIHEEVVSQSLRDERMRDIDFD